MLPKTDRETRLEIANTILEQLGGRRFQVMTGARNFAAIESGLTFQIPKAKNGIRYVKIILEPSDTYYVEFWSYSGKDSRLVTSHENIYHDMLQDLFTEETGLYTRL